MYVEEKNRSWASSSRDNDNRAITIEVANDGNASTNWHVSDIALEKTIELCVDICKRNNINKLIWTGDDMGTLTVHRFFTVTTCPGEYLFEKMNFIANSVNNILKGDNENMFKIGDLTVTNEKDYQKASITKAIEQGLFEGDGVTFDVSETLTKGDFCVILNRLGLIK